jgi:hypothetical protein
MPERSQPLICRLPFGRRLPVQFRWRRHVAKVPFHQQVKLLAQLLSEGGSRGFGRSGPAQRVNKAQLKLAAADLKGL